VTTRTHTKVAAKANAGNVQSKFRGPKSARPPGNLPPRARSSIPGFLEDYILDHVASADLLVCVGTSSGTLELDHLDVVQIGE